MSTSKGLRNFLPQLILGISLLTLYLYTLAPGLSWANDGSDGGDLITAAATGGVAHPTGYPLFLLFARLFQYLPIGSLAFRTNLMSALFAALASVFVYRIVARSASMPRLGPVGLSGLAAAYAFGLAPLVWSQAVITEVYALQAFLITLLVYLYAVPKPLPDRSSHDEERRLDCWRGFVLGAAACNQITTVLFLPVALALGSLRSCSESESSQRANHPSFRNLKFDADSFRRQLVFLGLGLALYLILPLRALTRPPINWGNAITPARLWWLVSGQLYQSYYLQFDLAQMGERIQSFAGLLIKQFGLPGLMIGLIGLVVYGFRSRLYVLTLWIAAASLIFTLFYHSSDSYVYLIPMLISFAIWIGLGLSGLAGQLSPRFPILYLGLSLMLIAYFIGRSMTFLSEVDASHDRRAETFGREVLAAAPKDAIVFAQGDKAVFTLWYFHFALHERRDIVVLAADLLHFDWYQETLRKVYPSLNISEPFPWPETITRTNPDWPVCYVRYTEQAVINCKPPEHRD